MERNVYKIGKELFITSDEEIKDGDWIFDNFAKINLVQKIRKCDFDSSHYRNGNWKKIILTTDQDLIKDSVQAIDDDFLEWFVKNPSCERVEVYEVGGKLFAEPIIPKEESRQETLEEAAKIIIPELKHIINDVSTARELWIKGAKWQAERMYSEEDMKSFGKFCSEYDYRCFGSKTQEEMLSIWFEQFKKK